MRLLYITQRINEEGGVQRVLSVKTDYLIKKWNYQISIITQNDGDSDVFFEFNKAISFYDISLKKGKLLNLIEYKKQLQKYISLLQPDCIIISDFALKSFSIPLFLKTDVPIIFEAHGSRFNEYRKTFFGRFTGKLKYEYRNYCASKFLFFVALSKESLEEWSIKNGRVISNPLWFKMIQTAELEEKKIIMVARHSYEKGIDRILKMWPLIVQKYPEWKLEIFGKSNKTLQLEKQQNDKNITFSNPVHNIQEIYKSASILVMTSRNEALPMVLIEAMAIGLPCVAYDCPVGPKAIIRNNENGFLIDEDDETSFIEKLSLLIEDEMLRKKMGVKAQESVQKYDMDIIMQQWKNFFEEIVKTNLK
ncbi:glycosyltransferase [Flavobacterium sp. IB48]|uniref:glycosyltransferase n=1 Tax=Flavobacterium sp. IB48 TaxID=2779375 RepID=UPI0018E74E3B|nr:glycosyltransferase [Flavobacterium sp. IB48]MBJ2125525.1 glycosyltransferase [Flavobacterium sp. IB48]